ncbi:MAG TPA: FAD-binding oxidoreductase [Anaerolineales bacterium]|nr:FAD-binding oxidoreductase [Anaerolineales bacterium]
MRRWNGWGDDEIEEPLPSQGAEFLAAALGPGTALPDASLDSVLSQVPASRALQTPGLDHEPLVRVLHARGQSLPDWVALRAGRLGVVPDAVAHPANPTDVAQLIRLAAERRWALIPYGGGTSVVGHVNPLPSEAPVVTVDLGGLNRLQRLDEASMLATFEAGVRGPDLEAALRARGFTLGHFPQSFEYSTLGGWIATRSTGQQSLHYGRIEAMFAGGHVEAPVGALDLAPIPASGAGPDLRQIVLGSEGRLGILTSAVVRVRRVAEADVFSAAFFPSWPSGIEAVRTMAQERLPLSMLRLSNPLETETTLALADRPNLVTWADRALRLLGYADGRCLLLLAATGGARRVSQARARAHAIIRRLGGLPAGTPIGSMWRKSRFRTPYLRNTLWERGYALDTLETAIPWSVVPAAAEAILAALRTGLESLTEHVLAFLHLSHVYPDGASLYATFLFRRSRNPDETLARWQRLKQAATRQILAHGGTLSHQHGVGLDHASYLVEEKGELGIRALRASLASFDPLGIMNPGKLIQ